MTIPLHAREGYVALRTLPDGRVAGVRREPNGYVLERGGAKRFYRCALAALHALGTWDERRNYAGVPDVGNIPSLGLNFEMPTDRPAPDGVPWRKCCEECQYRDLRTIEHVEADCAAAGVAFYCIHREDDAGHHRVCAGFAARDPNRRDPDTGEVWHERDDARRMAETT